MKRRKKQFIDYYFQKIGVEWCMVSPDPEFIMPIGIYNGGRQKPIAVINGTEYDLTEHDLILSIREY